MSEPRLSNDGRLRLSRLRFVSSVKFGSVSSRISESGLVDVDQGGFTEVDHGGGGRLSELVEFSMPLFGATGGASAALGTKGLSSLADNRSFVGRADGPFPVGVCAKFVIGSSNLISGRYLDGAVLLPEPLGIMRLDRGAFREDLGARECGCCVMLVPASAWDSGHY